MHNTNRYTRSLAATLLLLATLAACQPGAPGADIPSYTIHAKDYTFDAPAEIPAGQVWIGLENDGMEIHHMQLLRLSDGVTFEQFQAELQEKGEAALALATFPGGVGILGPHGQGRVLLDLIEGQYVLICFLPSADGVPHLAKGMVVPMRVVASDQPAKTAPEAQLAATLKDFTVQLPAEIKAGPQLWKVTNEGPQPHEVMILKLEAGKTENDVLTYMRDPQGDAPFEWMGGMQALSAGRSALLKLDLTPGNYAAFCQVPDPESGSPHHLMGMVTAFSVR